jgi:hypothetical protein
LLRPNNNSCDRSVPCYKHSVSYCCITKMAVFWDVAPCTLAAVVHRFVSVVHTA